jgi:hypothetical protein
MFTQRRQTRDATACQRRQSRSGLSYDDDDDDAIDPVTSNSFSRRVCVCAWVCHNSHESLRAGNEETSRGVQDTERNGTVIVINRVSQSTRSLLRVSVGVKNSWLTRLI